ncbi:unnamed protein product [Parnassius apollo]|uniref:(apollo) hypothetical protein n=1 Tax=Parnassius apollo TaxID=110799 RepID=A0A8S3Y3W6_PARAO|nr:unnamed protein product [Parnassius apollo]
MHPNPVRKNSNFSYFRPKIRLQYVAIHLHFPTRRIPPVPGTDCWASENPADTKPDGGDDGCEGLLGVRAAPHAQLAVRISCSNLCSVGGQLSRPVPAPDTP